MTNTNNASMSSTSTIPAIGTRVCRSHKTSEQGEVYMYTKTAGELVILWDGGKLETVSSGLAFLK